MPFVIASDCMERGDPESEVWIASSLLLLAMTGQSNCHPEFIEGGQKKDESCFDKLSMTIKVQGEILRFAQNDMLEKG